MGVFSELKPVNHARKNPFDLSCYSTYNTKVGMVLPLQSWPTLPSSKYKLDLKALMRTQPLHTAAFAGFSINYDVVWSPYNDHYSSFNQFVAQRLNKQHTTQPDIREIPSFPLFQFVHRLLPVCVFEAFLSEVSDTDRAVLESLDYNIFIRSHVFRSFNFPSENMPISCLRTLDLLGYGNFLPVFKGYLDAFKKYLDTGVTYGWDSDYENQDLTRAAIDKSLPYAVRYLALLNSSYFFEGKIREISGSVSGFKDYLNFDDLVDNFYILLPNLRQYGIYDIVDNSDMIDNTYSLWSIMTYNKVWWQFYRNEYYDEDYRYIFCDDYESSTVRTVPYVNLFNFDDFASFDDQMTNFDVFERFICMFAVKPHQYKKDLFTGLLPSTQYGSVSVATSLDVLQKISFNMFNSTQSKSLNRGDLFITQSNGVAITPYTEPKQTNGYQVKIDPAPAIEVLELRRADALQRFKERMLRAGNRTKDIFKAHGWDEPYSEKAFEAEFLGTFDGRLDLNVVTSTADTERVNLGQLAANGIGVIGGNSITFESHDFGTLMVVAYLTKDAVYDAYGIDSVHTKLEPFDFPYPELQNVSLSAIQANQVFSLGDFPRSILGFLPQNMTYKTAVDKVHGEFFAVNPFDVPSEDYERSNFVTPVGIFANMVTPRLDIKASKALEFFYIQTDCADNIFVVNSDVLQDTDQFFANVHFDLKAVQPLDVIGLPI